MGTTVTANLALIKPDTDESIREDLPTFDGWATQNEANMDQVDSLFRQTTGTFNPVWGASTTPPTLGTGGFTEGRYIRILPRMVIFYFRLFCGTAGFVAGSGSYNLELPIAIDPAFAAFSHTVDVGRMIFQDNNSALLSSSFTLQYFPSIDRVVARPDAGGSWTNVLPAIPASNDRYAGYFMYPTAVV